MHPQRRWPILPTIQGVALKVVARTLNTSIESVIAVGDQPNDVEMIAEAGLGVAVANAHEACRAAADVVLDRTNNEAVRLAAHKPRFAREVGDLADAVSGEPIKLLFIGEPSVLDDLERRWGPLVAGEARLVRSQTNYLECLAPNVNKGVALKVVARTLNTSIESVIAVGDQPNDVEMIAEAGLGVAVANAHEACRAAADVVLDRTNNEAAVEEVVERFLKLG